MASLRRFLVVLLAAALLLGRAHTVGASDLPPKIQATAYLLMENATGEVLAEQQGRTRLPMASTTKIMTAILALEKGNLSDQVTVGQRPYDTGGSTIYLELGEKQTLENLLYALVLVSANDAAVAVAEHLAGTEEKFTEWMNAKAREIGAVDTHFVNSHGLHHEEHYSTAYDLALITRYALKNKAFRDLITVLEKEIPGFKNNPPRALYNSNRLLGYYDGTTGVKNGFTEHAGLTNVASARRGETELIAVILGAEEKLWTGSMALLDYGFTHFSTFVAMRKGEFVASAPVAGAGVVSAVAAQDVAAVLPVRGAMPERRLLWYPGLKAPVADGANIGEVQLVSGGKVVARGELLARNPVQTVRPMTTAGAAEPDPERGIVSAGYLTLGAAFLLVMLSFLMRMRRRTRSGHQWGGGKPFGRERLYEIRNRRR